MLKAILRNRAFVEVDSILMDHIKSELTYTIPVKVGMTEVRYVKLYDYRVVNSRTLSIPIGRVDLIPSTHEIIDKRVYNMVDFHITPGVALRPDQQEIYDKAEDNCIVNAGCAFGKTFTGLFLAEKFGQKTLVIVHTKKLQDQWLEEVRKVFGMEAGIIGGGKYQLDRNIIIAMKQTLDSKADMKTYNEFGTVIVDETHHVAARTFNDILNNFRARYKIGLTATLRRKDEKQFLILNYISHDNIYKPKDGNSLIPEVVAIHSGIVIPGASTWQDRVTRLIENNDYISLILDVVQRQANNGHKVLCIGSRVNLLKHMQEVIPKSDLIIGGTVDTKEVIKRIHNHETEVIFGSTQVMSEGISINPLSCLIYATPFNSDIVIEQTVGRIIRLYEGKLNPVIIDIILKGSTGGNQWRNRKNYYLSKGYKITEVS